MRWRIGLLALLLGVFAFGVGGELLFSRGGKTVTTISGVPLAEDALKELASALDPLDPRWKSFGLNMPGAQHIPGVPQNLVVALHEGHRSEHGDAYRLRVRHCDRSEQAKGKEKTFHYTAH